MQPEQRTFRCFQCAYCREQVLICTCCDRGNIYCPPCAPIAHQVALKEAAKRYQSTPQGKKKHAQRQRRYQASKNKNNADLTHKGSQGSGLCDSLILSYLATVFLKGCSKTRCHFCQKEGPIFLRVDFLRTASRQKVPILEAGP